MNLFQKLYIYLKLFFEKLSFRTKPKQDIFYDYIGDREYDCEITLTPLKYEFIPISEKMDR